MTSQRCELDDVAAPPITCVPGYVDGGDCGVAFPRSQGTRLQAWRGTPTPGNGVLVDESAS